MSSVARLSSLFVVHVALVMGGCASHTSPTVNLFSPDEQNLANSVIGMDQLEYGNACPTISLLQRDVLARDDTGKPYIERWLVDACGQKTRYRVTYSTLPNGVKPDGTSAIHFSREE
ncbi:MAG TPA: hypothetical protein VM659_27525 [Dongiaceae bacterium]|nr:hypothetical protein [Dongiaceae bacterium]